MNRIASPDVALLQRLQAGEDAAAAEAVTVGIMVHNEAANIGACLEAIRQQRLDSVRLERILVVSSGSTDETDALVAREVLRDDRIVLLTQPRRLGKISAINAFLEQTYPGELVALVGGDTLPELDCLERLFSPLLATGVGMTGGRPVPTNDAGTFCGFLGHLLWSMHHRIALRSPKLGEVVAFRSPGEPLREDAIVDEAYLESRIVGQGLRLVYVPEAIVRNRGPETIEDFLVQYRRNLAGHLVIKRRYGYSVSTLSFARAALALAPELSVRPGKLMRLVGAAGVFTLARMLGYWDYCFHPDRHRIWRTARSTKRLVPVASEPAPSRVPAD